MLRTVSLLLIGVLVCRANVRLQNTLVTQQGAGVAMAQSPFGGIPMTHVPMGFPPYGFDDDFFGMSLAAQSGMPFYGGYGGIDDDYIGLGLGSMRARPTIFAGTAPGGLNVGQLAALAVGSTGISAPTAAFAPNPLAATFNDHAFAAAATARVQPVAPLVPDVVPAMYDLSGRTSIGAGHTTGGLRNSFEFGRANIGDVRALGTGSASHGSSLASFG